MGHPSANASADVGHQAHRWALYQTSAENEPEVILAVNFNRSLVDLARNFPGSYEMA